MKIVVSNKTLELTAKKDSMELGLGVALTLFALFFFYSAPQAWFQEWSYKFGAVPKWERVCFAILYVLLGLFCLLGGAYNLFKKSVYAFNMSDNVFLCGETFLGMTGLSKRPLSEISGIVSSSKEISQGKTRFWIGVSLASQEKILFAEYFDNKADSDKVLSTIKDFTGLQIINQ